MEKREPRTFDFNPDEASSFLESGIAQVGDILIFTNKYLPRIKREEIIYEISERSLVTLLQPYDNFLFKKFYITNRNGGLHNPISRIIRTHLPPEKYVLNSGETFQDGAGI